MEPPFKTQLRLELSEYLNLNPSPTPEDIKRGNYVLHVGYLHDGDISAAVCYHNEQRRRERIADLACD